MTTYRYSIRIIGTFEDSDYTAAQAHALTAFGALTGGRLQSIELSQWEQPVVEGKETGEPSRSDDTTEVE